ncbi:hypothetical protein GRI97_03115 [Altererythrobacter xixiisoli]|uniref:Uncharacterized protein n=1 Tax=Croceibacterium xixiisoli TaxID=1476466 RepID=A0A6I4TRP4_9SPHN|nr:hypothetical protein [Croceibacterium xixiisoli]MXO97979.1 hypothetical protein [Croceibacterium xixiisoli]
MNSNEISARLAGDGIPFRSADAIRNHPQFDLAFASLMDGIATLYGDTTLLVRRLMEYDRAVAFMAAVGLDFAQHPDVPESWLTVERLRGALVSMHLTSARRISNLVTSMEGDGLLETKRASGDRRVRILKASELALALDREWLKVFHQPLHMLNGDARYEAAIAKDPAYQRAYRVAGLRTLELAGTLVKNNVAAEYFLQATAGIRIMAHMFRETRGKPDGRTGPGFYSQVAEQCAVSRVHVRNVLHGARDLGLVELSTPPGLYVAVTPMLRDVMEEWVSQSLSAVDLVCAFALEDQRE